MEELLDRLNDVYPTDRKCPKCGGNVKHFGGGDQGGVPHDFCTECFYEEVRFNDEFPHKGESLCGVK